MTHRALRATKTPQRPSFASSFLRNVTGPVEGGARNRERDRTLYVVENIQNREFFYRGSHLILRHTQETVDRPRARGDLLRAE